MVSAPVALLAGLGGADTRGADALVCNDLLRDLKKVRGWVDAKTAEVTARLDQLARQGQSFGSETSNSRCSGMSAREASKHKGRADTIEAAKGFGDALAEGDVTAEHVDKLAAVAGHLDDEVRAALFDKTDELLEHATSNDPGRFGRHVRDLARRLERDAGISRDQQQRAATHLSITLNTGTGMYDLAGSLHPELGAKVKRALDLHVAAMIKRGEADQIPEFVNRTVNRRRLAADALGELIAAGHGEIRPTVADITVLVDEATLETGELHDHSVCESGDGAPLPIDSVRALLCLGRITPVYVDRNGTVLDLGRTTRTANRAQRRALRAMYRTCAVEGCDTPFDRCEMHHIDWWEHGGLTDLGNLLPVCAHHHHLIHTLRWHLHLSADRTLTITDQHGQVVMVTTPDMPHRGRGDQRRTKPSGANREPIAS
ncbi:MAG TPA: DUF222 domain-containing protein [Ilumatobacter sp.]|nr:DUF222 domain-containing protein [Ilumatobacter sp.]